MVTTVSPLWMLNQWLQGLAAQFHFIHFLLGDLNIRGFWYPQGPGTNPLPIHGGNCKWLGLISCISSEFLQVSDWILSSHLECGSLEGNHNAWQITVFILRSPNSRAPQVKAACWMAWCMLAAAAAELTLNLLMKNQSCPCLVLRYIWRTSHLQTVISNRIPMPHRSMRC